MSNERSDASDSQPEEEVPEAEKPGAILVPHGAPVSVADRMAAAALKSGAMTSIPPAPDPDAGTKTPPYVHCVDDQTRPV